MKSEECSEEYQAKRNAEARGKPLSWALKASWPTTTEMDKEEAGGKGKAYLKPILKASWPTPREGKTTSEEMETWQKRKDAGGVATPPLGALVGSYGTPRVVQTNRSSAFGVGREPTPGEVLTDGINSSGCLALTEKFVVRLTTLSAWLMGYTAAYLGHWETQSSRKSHIGS
ncbi:MAG: hypothetical protein LLG06_19655 [Desulfobacteraceae bacterium]|nr:hypothetical protein [Desulfobacteraceae bacterium]